jgi:hypothetical integral membrane protein (TIGR02206 family)
MQPYGPDHFLVLGVTAALIVAAPLAVHRARDTRRTERLIALAGWALLVLTLLWLGWGLLPAHWNIGESLPLHFSDALRITTAIALITRSGWAVAVSYFWGLTLNLQTLITPNLNYYDAPVLEFAMYWLLHVAALLAPIVLVWGLGYRPTWSGYGATLALTISWAALALAANAVTGANYGYLSRAPEGPSILDVLGPWPVYLLWEAVLVAVVWACMTLPWTTRAARASAPVVDRLGLIRRKRPCEPTPLPAVGERVRR